MADPFVLTRGDLMQQILRRVAAGERLSAICQAQEMPETTTIRNWRRAYPGFDQTLAEAFQRGAARRRQYDPVRGEAFLARFRNPEERLAHILKDPAMPSRALLMAWLRQNSMFREAYDAAAAARDHFRLRGLRTAKEPAAFDPQVADRVLVALVQGRRLRDFHGRGDGLPGMMVIGRWRREQPVFDAEVRAALRAGRVRASTAGRNCQALSETIAERITEGASLHSLSQEPGMPSATTLYRWVKAQPAFAQLMDVAAEDRDDLFTDRMMQALDGMPRATGRQIKARLAPLSRQRARLRHRPGAKRARARAAAMAAEDDG